MYSTTNPLDHVHHNHMNPESITTSQLELFSQHTAAIKIQQAWKRHQQKKEYKAIRDLILFHNEGKPADLIRSVAQSESFLCDGATRLFVRFRLQGKTFPPQIVYKIFTSSNVCDVNAFGPRNYSGGLLPTHRPHALWMSVNVISFCQNEPMCMF